jgi:hypothetical protein
MLGIKPGLSSPYLYQLSYPDLIKQKKKDVNYGSIAFWDYTPAPLSMESCNIKEQ